MVASILAIAAGTALAAIGDVSATVVGLALMLGSEVFEAARLVLTQLLLTGMSLGAFEGVMFMVRPVLVLTRDNRGPAGFCTHMHTHKR